MKRFFVRGLLLLVFVWLGAGPWITRSETCAQEKGPQAIQIVAPDGLSTKIYNKPSTNSEMIGIALNGAIHEMVGGNAEFVEIALPDIGSSGFVVRAHTRPWEPPKDKGISPVILWIIGIGVGGLILAGAIVLWTRARKTKVAAQRAVSIPASIKRAEELFRAGEYDGAAKEFNTYLDMQGGDVRNPDVYRRLSVCYQNLGQIREAAIAWEKMRDLGGLKAMEDYTLGVSLMMQLGKEAAACQIYEQLLESEQDEERQLEIRRRLYHSYRRTKDGKQVLKHALVLLGSSEDTGVVGETVGLLISEGQSDLAIESNNETIIKALCEEFLEEKAKSPAATRAYVKALEYNRTDKRLHGILAQIYAEGGDYRRAVSELTILHQLDKGQSDEYMAQAAKLYVENNRVQEAIAEGNPLIIKKIAQIYLARSEVNPDAVAVYEKVLEFQPRAVGINKMLSTVYLTRGDLVAYTEKLRLLHQLDGKNYDYLTDLARCIIDNDLIDDTIKEGNRELNSKILKQLIKRGSSDDKTVTLFEKLIKYEPSNTPIRGALVAAYEKRQEYDRFLHHALALSSLRPADTELAERAAKIAVEHNLWETMAKAGKGKALELTANMIVAKKINGPACRRILEQAVKENPRNSGIMSYLTSLSSSEPPPPEAQSPDSPKIPREAPPKPGVSTQAPTARAQQKKPAGTKAKSDTAPSQKQVVQAPKAAPAKPVVSDSMSASRTAGDLSGPTSPPREPKRSAQKNSAQSPPPSRPQGHSASQPDSLPDFSDLPERDTGPGESRPSAPAQFVDMSDESIPMEDRALTTFVSGYSRGLAAQYRREELFLPASGGLAYKDLDVLFSDGWSDFRVGIEVNTGRHVLMRVFRRNLLDRQALKDFIDQVCDLAFNIQHEGILPLHESVIGPGGTSALVHPFYARNLEQAMKARKLELAQTSLIIRRILTALTYAHNYKGLDGKLRRTFHLHLQPGQIVVNEDLSESRLASLGYAQVYRNITRASKPRWQEPGMNPATMPPEFFRSRTSGVRERHSEVYSLGVLLHFMITGEYPFQGPAFEDYKFQHTRLRAKPLTQIAPDVPDWLNELIMMCLEKVPEDRPDSTVEVHTIWEDGMKKMGIE